MVCRIVVFGHFQKCRLGTGRAGGFQCSFQKRRTQTCPLVSGTDRDRDDFRLSRDGASQDEACGLALPVPGANSANMPGLASSPANAIAFQGSSEKQEA